MRFSHADEHTLGGPMKKIMTVIVSVLIVGVSSSVLAGPKRHSHRHNSHADFAKVVFVKPIYTTVRVEVPEQQCWHEEKRVPVRHRVNYQHQNNVVLGGIVGGLIGHELGDDRNRHVATVAGTIIGSAIAHNASLKDYQPAEYRIKHREVCQTKTRVVTREELIGYRVKYRYRGQLHWTRMRNHPGKRIRVNVEVTPVSRY